MHQLSPHSSNGRCVSAGNGSNGSDPSTKKSICRRAKRRSPRAWTTLAVTSKNPLASMRGNSPYTRPIASASPATSERTRARTNPTSSARPGAARRARSSDAPRSAIRIGSRRRGDQAERLELSEELAHLLRKTFGNSGVHRVGDLGDDLVDRAGSAGNRFEHDRRRPVQEVGLPARGIEHERLFVEAQDRGVRREV